mgnify:FL=1
MLELQEESGITPFALQNRPVLDDRLSYFYSLFLDVSNRCRTYDAEGRPLDLTAAAFLAYCQVNGWPAEDMRWAWPMVATIDDVWLGILRAAETSKTPQTQA